LNFADFNVEGKESAISGRLALLYLASDSSTNVVVLGAAKPLSDEDIDGKSD
jgi:hypothetical protein